MSAVILTPAQLQARITAWSAAVALLRQATEGVGHPSTPTIDALARELGRYEWATTEPESA